MRPAAALALAATVLAGSAGVLIGSAAVLVGSAGVLVGSASAAESYQLPPEVTPSMRAACESDVRRLCIGENPTIEKVKACVARKFTQLGRRCQIELASAGFSP